MEEGRRQRVEGRKEERERKEEEEGKRGLIIFPLSSFDSPESPNQGMAILCGFDQTDWVKIGDNRLQIPLLGR